MKKLLSVFLLLALTLTACKSAATAKPSESPETQPATVQGCGSGEVRMLSAADGGYYYTSFTDGEVNRTDEIGRILIYAIDEATGTARPACNLLGCTHDSDDCPAHITGTATCYADGGEVYLYICQYKEAEDTTVFRLEKISADHTQRVCLADDLPFGWVQPTGMAADDSYLYFLTTNNYNDTTMSAMLLAVSKETGDRQTLYQMDSLENGRGSTGQVTFINLAGAHGRQLYFFRSENASANTASAEQLWCYDLASKQCTQIPYCDTDEDSSALSYYTLTGYGGSFSSGIAVCNKQTGTASVLDAATGESTLLAENLPTALSGHGSYYSIFRYTDGWLLIADEICDDKTISTQYF
ncbi:MAG: hypothetical protein SPF77_01630, partial [Gemmiger sp.]|uniref:hypothetical protein n=1 Tax=Gemmiger sp. TaxID=2049027 RepID=UPI002A90E445